ncbi:hypothetical protein FCULG_00001921 [Fusarium culmorum]|uniref:Uncharacterized protein n=1 Tax=Fusarium culmorum TaxID=5516 RepID=A0A2T4GKR6_FUSCU|nr:hypothetical protein FCULG_00001921 [Fusarium culmorum]
MTSESQTSCTESIEDAPIQYSAPGTDVIQPTIHIYEAPVHELEPGKQSITEYHPPVSVPISEPDPPPIPTESVQAPVVEPTVIHQPQPDPSTFKTVTSLVPAPANQVVKLNLSDATLGLYATFIEIDGHRAIRLAPPPNGEASFTIEVNTNLEFPPDSFVKLLTSIKVENICPNTKRNSKVFERDDAGNGFRAVYDKKTISKKELKGPGKKTQQIDSKKFKPEVGKALQVIVKGGSNPVAGTVTGASLRKS